MKKFLHYLFIIPFLIVLGCSKNPCDDLDNGAYKYPEPETRDKSADIYEFFNIPEPILQCISTDGLIESCITYPHIVLVWTRNSLQQGFDYIERKFNGFDELWRRNDKIEALIDLYSQLDFERDWTNYSDAENGKYSFNIIYHEIIIAQEEILTELTDSQKLELFQLVLEKLKIKMLKYQEFGGLGVAGSVAILARIMKNDQYQPFIKKYENSQALMFTVE
ncbi:MAG: hypothetical protein ACP5E3_05680, partial [Bacteroidales bacterium]